MRRGAMTELDDLKTAIERMHGGTARLAQSVPVKETHEGRTAWEGVVHIFNLDDHPTATRAYAWSSPIEGSDKRRFFAVLQAGPSNPRPMQCGRLSWRNIGQSKRGRGGFEPPTSRLANGRLYRLGYRRTVKQHRNAASGAS